jgi:hypothetical protein
MSSAAQHLTIEIEPGEPIHGRLLDDSGATQAFRGWLELSAMLESRRRWAEATHNAATTAEDVTRPANRREDPKVDQAQEV